MATQAWAWRKKLAGFRDWLTACTLQALPRLAGLVLPIRPLGMQEPLWCRTGSSDFPVLKEIFFQGEYADIRRHIPGPVHTVLDLGANVGFAARWFAAIWPGCHFICVEPGAANIAMLHKNLGALLAAGRVRIVPAFIGGKKRSAWLESRGLAFATIGQLRDIPGRSTGPAQIEVVTGAEILAQSPRKIDFVKMDIEGSEKEVLEGPLAWLAAVQWLLVEVHAPLDETWLSDIVAHRMPDWSVISISRRRPDTFLAYLGNRACSPADKPANISPRTQGQQHKSTNR